MVPGGFPFLPVTIFPAVGFPSLATGLTAVDVTAAIAALVWALGGLVALRIAIAMSRERDLPSASSTPAPASPADPHRDGLRDAA